MKILFRLLIVLNWAAISISCSKEESTQPEKVKMPDKKAVVEEVWDENDETYFDDWDYDVSISDYTPIKYFYHGWLERDHNNKPIAAVLDPITADPIQSTYFSSTYGLVTRRLTLYNHSNYYVFTPLGLTAYWSCTVFARYTPLVGDEWTKIWNKYYSKSYY